TSAAIYPRRNAAISSGRSTPPSLFFWMMSRAVIQDGGSSLLRVLSRNQLPAFQPCRVPEIAEHGAAAGDFVDDEFCALRTRLLRIEFTHPFQFVRGFQFGIGDSEVLFNGFPHIGQPLRWQNFRSNGERFDCSIHIEAFVAVMESAVGCESF